MHKRAGAQYNKFQKKILFKFLHKKVSIYFNNLNMDYYLTICGGLQTLLRKNRAHWFIVLTLPPK